MRIDKLTVKSREALAQAQELAGKYKHAEVAAEHLLAALLGQDEGLVPRLLQRVGVAPEAVSSQLEIHFKDALPDRVVDPLLKLVLGRQ